MNKALTLTLLILLVSGTSMAVVDPDDNSMGFYFDTQADIFEANVPIYTPANIYIILTNPTFPEILGFELGFTVSDPGIHIVLSALVVIPGYIDVGGTPGNHIVGLASPHPCTEATHLMTLQVMLLAPQPVNFTLHNAEPASIPGILTPVVLLPDFSLLPVGTSSFYDGMPQVNAIMNGTGVIATERTSLDRIKSLYR